MGNNASADCQRYLDHYPGLVDDPRAVKNAQFYSNTLASRPDGALVDVIHQEWWGNYQLLEAHHGYIQWLFPIREDGLNHLAQPLQLHEADLIKSTPAMQERVVMSYRMMLDFYGMKLVRPDAHDGEVERADNYRRRYDHLNSSFHNYLRITRILKCLGEVGLEQMKLPFLKFVLREIFENGELRNCAESAARFWSGVLRDPDERAEIAAYVEKHMPSRREAPQRTYGGRSEGGVYGRTSNYGSSGAGDNTSNDCNPFDDSDEAIGSDADMTEDPENATYEDEHGDDAGISAEHAADSDDAFENQGESVRPAAGPSAISPKAASTPEVGDDDSSVTEADSIAECAGESVDDTG